MIVRRWSHLLALSRRLSALAQQEALSSCPHLPRHPTWWRRTSADDATGNAERQLILQRFLEPLIELVAGSAALFECLSTWIAADLDVCRLAITCQPSLHI